MTSPPTTSSFTGGPPMPTQPFYVVGDVHGRADLLAPLFERLLAQPDQIVCVGDYIDRGPDSAKVLRLLQEASLLGNVTCLRGNHEEMLLRFIKHPRKNGRYWLRYGGAATLASYGIAGITLTSEPAEFVHARDALMSAMGDTIAWLNAVPYWWRSGNVAVAHAGADRTQPLADQLDRAFAWGHPEFANQPRTDGMWVIRGHAVVADPHIENGRVHLDTGAYKTGTLTALHVTMGEFTVL